MLVSRRKTVTCAPSSVYTWNSHSHMRFSFHISYTLSFSLPFRISKILHLNKGMAYCKQLMVCMHAHVSCVSALTGWCVFSSLMLRLHDALQVPWDALGKNGRVLFNVRNMGQLQSLWAAHRVKWDETGKRAVCCTLLFTGAQTGKGIVWLKHFYFTSTSVYTILYIWKIHIYTAIHILTT